MSVRSSQATFKMVEHALNSGENQVEISGYINESAIFTDVAQFATIRVSLGGVVGLNSPGTRNWCRWLKLIAPPTQVLLEKCPAIFVKAFSQVSGSLTENSKVMSFYVPFYSEKCGERTDILFVRDQHFGANGITEMPKVVDSKNNLMELDVTPESYFLFLRTP